MESTALLVIDVQQSFEQMPFWSEEGLEEYKRQQNALIAHARQKGWPVVFVYHESRGVFSRESGYLEPMDWVDRREGDPVFYKRVHNAITESGLESFLQSEKISRLVVSGIRTEQCCETTTRVASDAGYEVEYILDATLTFPMETQSGEVVSADAIKQHTSLVLHRRFATVWALDDFIAWQKPASINSRCPRSGNTASSTSLTTYRGQTVAFCNPGCSSSFAADPQAFGLDRAYFDRLIERQGLAR